MRTLMDLASAESTAVVFCQQYLAGLQSLYIDTVCLVAEKIEKWIYITISEIVILENLSLERNSEGMSQTWVSFLN